MDAKLVGWARAVKARQRGRSAAGHACTAGLPPLWLFTDTLRLGNPRRAVAGLPPGLCGVVLRDDAVADRAALARDLARLCRARRNLLVVAGDPRLARAVGAGLHLRAGRRRLMPGVPGRVVTSSAHGVADLWRAHRAGAALAFLSPAFATRSHPGAPQLGPARWGSLAARAPARLVVGALGGIAGTSLRRLPVRCVGAIDALAP